MTAHRPPTNPVVGPPVGAAHRPPGDPAAGAAPDGNATPHQPSANPAVGAVPDGNATAHGSAADPAAGTTTNGNTTAHRPLTGPAAGEPTHATADGNVPVPPPSAAPTTGAALDDDATPHQPSAGPAVGAVLDENATASGSSTDPAAATAPDGNTTAHLPSAEPATGAAPDDDTTPHQPSANPAAGTPIGAAGDAVRTAHQRPAGPAVDAPRDDNATAHQASPDPAAGTAPGTAPGGNAAAREPVAGPVAPRGAVVALPRGELRFRLHRHALLRGAGFDVRPLGALHRPAPLRDAPDASAEDVAREHAEALEAGLRTVRELLGRERLRQAVGISNPVFHAVAFGPGRPLVSATPYAALNGRGRRQVRTGHRYVRRLLAKTETNAFFGPTVAVSWDGDAPAALLVGAPGAERCALGLSHWVTAELTRRLRRELPAAERGWRRDPSWRLGAAGLASPLTGRRIALDEAAAVVWAHLAEPACPRELTAATGLATAEVATALRLLLPALLPWPEPPATLNDGLGWVERAFPGRPLVAELAALTAQAAPDADPLALRTRIRTVLGGAGLETSRASGRHYADRDAVTEDRAGRWSGRMRLGAPALASATAALGDGLPLLVLGALLRQADAREAVRAHTRGRTAGLLELARRPPAPVTRRADELARRLDALLPDGSDCLPDPEVRWDPPAVAAAVADLWRGLEPLPDDQFGCLPGADLMCANGGPGEGTWVLSECHDDSSSALGGITARVQPAGRFAELADAVRVWLDTNRLATVVGRRRSRHITPELPGLRIELSGVAAGPRERVVPAAEVEVSADGARVVHGGVRHQLYPGDVPGPLFAALSLPCVTPVAVGAGRPVTPRVVLGGLVLQRRTWRIGLPALGDGVAGWRAARAWQRAWGMPDQVFLRHPGEPKPLLVDFGDALAVADLGRLAPGPVGCTEVLPALTDTWWCRPAPQPAELRLPVLVRWEPDGGRQR
ncbi:hypothetical protein ACWERV_04810 [Streptomyces sp. NPDC004031]